MGRWGVGQVVLAAAVVGLITRLGTLAPFVLGGLLVVASVVAIQWRQRRSTRPELDPSWFVAPLTISWLLLLLLPVHKFSHRGYSDTGPSLSLESFVEVLVFAGVALVALAVLRSLEPTLAVARPPLVLFLFPVWTATTGLWSATGAFAMVRGAQMAVVALLAWATIALARADDAALREVVESVLRWFVRIALGLVALGVAFGPQYVVTSDENRDRFTWIGAHPLLAGLILSVAFVIVAATPARVLRMPAWMRVASAVVLIAALVPNHSRQSWLGIAVALVVALILAGRLNPLFRWIGAPLVGAGVVASIMYAGPQLWDYVLRNEESETLGTGNGRLGLWSIAYRHLETTFDWMAGLGHGVTRTVFVADEPWARTAHSSFLAALVATGLIGMFLFVVTLVLITRDIARARLWEQAPTGLTLTLLYVVILLNAVVADSLAEPTLGFAMLYLIAAVAAVGRARRSVAPDVAHPARAEGTGVTPVSQALRP